MSKPTGKQIGVLDNIVSEINFMISSNDIHSPSHYSSIDELVGTTLAMECEEIDNEGDINKLQNALYDILDVVKSISKCKIRK